MEKSMSDKLLDGLIAVLTDKRGTTGWIITAAIVSLCSLSLGALFLAIRLAQH